MKWSKMSPEELEAESLKLHAVRQEMSKRAIRAVEEMMKHPLWLEQKREQIRRNQAIAEKLEKRSSNTMRE